MQFDVTVLVGIALAIWFIVDGVYMIINKRFRNAKSNEPYTPESLDKGIPYIGVSYIIASVLIIIAFLAAGGILPKPFIWIFTLAALVVFLVVWFVVKAKILVKR